MLIFEHDLPLMGKITTVKGDLFTAPKGSMLIHAVNCKGVWGSGIAKQFAKRFPDVYEVYHQTCVEKGDGLLGTCLLIETHGYTIACLFTSKNYGQDVDKPVKILESTKLAISDLIKQNKDHKPLHSCKINSGLFKVPWNETKAILKESEADFTVYNF